MLKRFTVLRLVAVTFAAVLSGCGNDRSALIAPLPGEYGLPEFGVAAGNGAKVKPLELTNHLAVDVTWAFDVGPEGTVVTNYATGLTISIPKGALASDTRITITAVRGRHLAYRFAPHGLQFAGPVELRIPQNAVKVKRDLFNLPYLVGGYFPDDSLTVDPTTGVARVAEVLPLSIDARTKAIRLEIRHFSGYTVASAITPTMELEQPPQ